MENSDVFGSATAPLTWHDFLERMRQPSAADFVKSIKSFIVSFSNYAPDPERDSVAVQEFLGNMEAAFKAHPLWAGCSEEELESAGEGLEKYVMTKLYSRVFCSHPEDVKVDDQLYDKMNLVQQFVRPENLDIKPIFQNESSWLLAQKELQKINMFKAPRDKLVCILNCCKVINNLLLNAAIASNEIPAGADDFLPVLIYVTMKANPPQLHSNLLYIQRYRRQTRLVGEAAYFFTNMLSAESFILNMDAKSISMEESEFEKNMELAQAIVSGLSAESDYSDQHSGHVPRKEGADPEHTPNNKKNQGTVTQPQLSMKLPNEGFYPKDKSSLHNVLSISDLENRGATELMKEDTANQMFQDFPYMYAQLGVLTIGDVEELLYSYKELVFKYVCLSKGLGVGIQPPLSSKKGQVELQPETSKESKDTKAVESNDDVPKDLNMAGDESSEISALVQGSMDSKLPESTDVPTESEEKNDDIFDR